MAVTFSNIFQVIGLVTWGVLFFSGTTNAGCTRMNIFDRDDGSGDFTPIRVLMPPYSPTCINLQPGTNWPGKARALRMTANINCIKVFSSSDCTGRGQCVCQKNHRVVTSWDRAIVPGGRALSFGNCDVSESQQGGIVQVFENKNFGGASESLEIPKGQCDSLRNDEEWKNKISSLKVTRGCVEYYKQAGCIGDKKVLFEKTSEFDNSDQAQSLESSWDNGVRSFKTCEVQPAPGPEPEVPGV